MKVYVIIDGYEYEGDEVIAVFDRREKAQEHLEWWKKHFDGHGKEECEKLPFGYKFAGHYRIAKEMELNKDVKE